MKFSRKMREIDAIQEKNHYYKSDLYKMQIAMPYTETINDLQQKVGTLEAELVKLKSRFVNSNYQVLSNFNLGLNEGSQRVI